MSLNQLPDELIAHVGTFLKDNTEFAKSQKRINRVLMRYGLNKPGCDWLEFYFNNANLTMNYKHDGIPVFMAPVNPGKLLYIFQEIVNSTRFIKNLVIEGNDDADIILVFTTDLGEVNMKAILQYLLATKVDIGTLRLNGRNIASSLTADMFVSFCKKFKSAPIADCFIRSMGFYRDEVFIDILSTTTFNIKELPLSRQEYRTDLTDLTLDALTYPKLITQFNIHSLVTLFTVGGIASLVEKLIEAEVGLVKLDLGVLESDKQFDVICWMNGINSNTDNTYTIRNDDDNEYAVVLKRWSVGQGNFIKFSVARKE